MPCGGNCATCQGTATFCTSCTGGQTLTESNTCESACPPGWYDQGGGICQACDNNCQTCLTVSTNCDTCGVIDGQQTYLHSDAKCYAICPTGFYGIFSTKYICTACDASCNGCSLISTNCIQCVNSTYFKVIGSNQCTNDCGTGYYGNTANADC